MLTSTRRRTAFAAVALTIVTAATVAASAPATTSGKNGQIAFRRYLDAKHTTSAIFAIEPDGSGERQITHPPHGVIDTAPDWSPDGSKLAFERCADRCEVWTIRADGSGARRLGPACSHVEPPKCEDRDAPSWSPDGRSIAFGRAWGSVGHDQISRSDVFVMAASGGGVHELTRVTSGHPFTADVDFGMWSADGKRLAFDVHTSKLGTPAKHRALFVVNADGSGLMQLTPWTLDGGFRPDWSPDGKTIVFRTLPHSGDDDEDGGNIYTIAPDGTGMTQLTHFGPKTRLNSYSYSPDGQWITFAKSGVAGELDVFVMRADGTDAHPVTRTPDWESRPDWGPR
jgi:TolB protein